MNRLEAVIFPTGGVYHLAPESDPAKVMRFPTLCGRDTTDLPRTMFMSTVGMTAPKTMMCAVCEKARKVTQFPEYPGEKVIARADKIDGSKIERASEAEVYRIVGGTDIYTVVVGAQVSTCTCMAGKTHSETMCKHQVAVWRERGKAVTE